VIITTGAGAVQQPARVGLTVSASEYLHHRGDKSKLHISDDDGFHKVVIDELVADEQGMNEPQDSPIRPNRSASRAAEGSMKGKRSVVLSSD
jgi:hypothetical protein